MWGVSVNDEPDFLFMFHFEIINFFLQHLPHSLFLFFLISLRSSLFSLNSPTLLILISSSPSPSLFSHCPFSQFSLNSPTLLILIYSHFLLSPSPPLFSLSSFSSNSLTLVTLSLNKWITPTISKNSIIIDVSILERRNDTMIETLPHQTILKALLILNSNSKKRYFPRIFQVEAPVFIFTCKFAGNSLLPRFGFLIDFQSNQMKITLVLFLWFLHAISKLNMVLISILESIATRNPINL